MNLSMQLIMVIVAAFLCSTTAAPESRLGRSKQQRPTRGFKNVEMMTARGFGKRDRPPTRSEHAVYFDLPKKFKPRSSLMVAPSFGKRSEYIENDEVYGLDNFWEMLEASPEKDGQETNDEKTESIPTDWFVNEMLANPEFARAAVRKFIDINQDGMLTYEELLRNAV